MLFEDVNLKINPGERIGLVGRNGHGKTTFLRLIAGVENPDKGKITVPKGYRVSYVQQTLSFTESTVLEECMKGLTEGEKQHHWKAEKILAGLGFSLDDTQKHPSNFSGGFQVRLNLAKEIISEPDLLLLDEPTNYLDITAIRWIEQFLNRWPHEILLVTHDRSFMDTVVTHTAGIHRKKMRKIAGSTGKYYEQIAQDEEIYEKTRINDERKRRDMELFIRRFRAKARLANMVQSRIKTLDKQEKKDKLEKLKHLDFSFKSCSFKGDFLAQAQDISFAYSNSTTLFKNLDMNIRKNDRICVVGKNGKGKTTLLKLLAGQLTPVTGELTWHANAIKGFFVQTNISSLVDKRTVEEEILYSHNDVNRQQARDICGAMMFQGDNALKKISILSGGEKSRVMLGKLLVTPVNILLLDEPTNHLDMESCDALLSALDNFDGAVVMVTHNEMFLHALATRLIVFQKGVTSLFDGNYQDFLDKIGWEQEKNTQESEQPVTLENAAGDSTDEEKLTRKKIRQMRSDIIARRSKTLKPYIRRIKELEDDIEALEIEQNSLNSAMQDAAQDQDGQKIAELSRKLHSTQGDIDRLFEILEEQTMILDEKKEVFETELYRLDQSLL